MIDIPPEGDAYNEERKEALYAAITNEASLVAHHAELVRGGATPKQLDEIVAAMAQSRRDQARISLELHNSIQGKNLNIFLTRMDASLGGVTAAVEGLRGDVQSLSKESRAAMRSVVKRVSKLETRMDASEADRGAISIRLLQIEDVNRRLGKIEGEVAAVAKEVVKLLWEKTAPPPEAG